MKLEISEAKLIFLFGKLRFSYGKLKFSYLEALAERRVAGRRAVHAGTWRDFRDENLEEIEVPKCIWKDMEVPQRPLESAYGKPRFSNVKSKASGGERVFLWKTQYSLMQNIRFSKDL